MESVIWLGRCAKYLEKIKDDRMEKEFDFCVKGFKGLPV